MSRKFIKARFEWLSQMAALSDAEVGRLFVELLNYAETGKTPEGSGREVILFPVFKAQIDKDNGRK